MNDHSYKIHARSFHAKAPASTWKRRPPQPAVSTTTTPTRETGELNLQRLAAAAAFEAMKAERKGKPVALPSDGTSIQRLSLRLLVAEAKQDLARLSANQRAAKRAEGAAEG